MIEMIRMTVVLTLIACAAALLIAFTNAKTEDKITGQQAAAQTAALQQILPDGATATPATVQAADGPVEYWNVSAGNDVYYAFKVGSRGYSSTISSLVCVDSVGTIVGMVVLEQNETPGLGTRVQEVLSKKYFWNIFIRSKGPREQAVPWFTEQFTGISIEKPIGIEKGKGEWHALSESDRSSLKEKNTITAITGSTISTRAVIKGISGKALQYFKAVRG